MLLFAGQLVKRFLQPARSQETILAAFQEEGWPPRVDDPLPASSELERRQRLHNALVRLNQGQTADLLRFWAEGKGEGICWEALAPGQS
jgi:hypothetical protein